MPVLIVSQIGTAISFFMLALAPNVAILFLARILDGITGGNIIVAQAYITDITPREKRTESLGFIFAVFGLGFIFGPAWAACFRPPLARACLISSPPSPPSRVVLLTWFTLDETLTPEQREANRSYNKGSIKPTDLARNLPLMLILVAAFVGPVRHGFAARHFCPLWQSGAL